jgi:osmotically-inducible protein OsmY
MKTKASIASLALALVLTACASPETSADTELSSRVLDSINSHADLRSDRLRVEARDRVVYLNGMADTWCEYYDAEEVARAVPGVKRVVNKIAVENRYG